MNGEQEWGAGMGAYLQFPTTKNGRSPLGSLLFLPWSLTECLTLLPCPSQFQLIMGSMICTGPWLPHALPTEASLTQPDGPLPLPALL